LEDAGLPKQWRLAVAKGEQPAFNVRAQVGGYWYNCGAAWHVKDGGISIRLNVLPVGEWDGSFLMLPPKEVNPQQEAGAGDNSEG
jgi:hypothetical protein